MKSVNENPHHELNEGELLNVTGGNSKTPRNGVVCPDLRKSECENYKECVYFKEGFHRGCLYR